MKRIPDLLYTALTLTPYSCTPRTVQLSVNGQRGCTYRTRGQAWGLCGELYSTPCAWEDRVKWTPSQKKQPYYSVSTRFYTITGTKPVTLSKRPLPPTSLLETATEFWKRAVHITENHLYTRNIEKGNLGKGKSRAILYAPVLPI